MLASTIKKSNNQKPTSTNTHVRARRLMPQTPNSVPYIQDHKDPTTRLCSTKNTPSRQQHIRLSIMGVLLRKEVIQPHLPVRLPCYDFVPIASPTFDGSFHKG